MALDRGYVVIAAPTEDQTTKCWTESDAPRIARMLHEFRRTYHPGLPLSAYGASSGGSLVTTFLADALEAEGERLEAIYAQVPATPLKQTTKAPCQVFLTMTRDIWTTTQLEKFTGKMIRLHAIPLTNDFWRVRVPSLSREDILRIMEAFHKDKRIDEHGFLVEDPRNVPTWRESLPDFDLVADRSPISEAMNVAYGMHEMTRDGMQEAFDYCSV